ncbi:hypothetical protein [Methylobacterium radiotolerans]|uniref:Uncharacterized protein n=1 Tax=Methylobacterium radiotolerans (strain ATCC 27329 / DSM 1819 / JCM 2831 / NBRC 15690 / NCIMB 10815 / 0-1) TaxID=426355 RepID=B1M2M4_METRJ|nr:hypothetical protein [Methylobacterium radiotolerans]ACB27672.1 hypothetical protein Mrad2831_5727 [Methylobacterium radiotolerans JCM 2831]GEM95885.1 hypothetical protein MRA01_04250 [Methylobacterium radiotolerans]
MLAALVFLLKLMVVASAGVAAGGLLGFRPIIAAITVLPALLIGCRALAVL